MRASLLIIAVLAAVTIASAVDKDCVQRRLLGLSVHWPNPIDCSRFYRCTNNNIKRELMCLDGKEYNPETGRCTSKEKSLCRLSFKAPLAGSSNPCAREISGIFVPDSGSCRSFYICNNNLAYPNTCDVGSYFNRNILACEPDTNSLCWENLCMDRKNGSYITDASDCRKFYICFDQKAVSQKCPTGSYFNEQISNCQPGDCPLSVTTESSTGETTITTTESNTEEVTTVQTTISAGETTTTTSVAETTTTTWATETTTTPCAEDKTTTTCTPEMTTTTCTPETTTTTGTPETTTTTCTPETTTTTYTPEIITTTGTPETTTTTYTPEITTTTCTPETTTTTCTPETTTMTGTSETTTTTCTPETTTTTSTPEMTTTTCTNCASETTTTCTICTPEATATTSMPETITKTCACMTSTTTCCHEVATTEPTTPAIDHDCSNTHCNASICQNAADNLIFPAMSTNAGYCVCINRKPQYRKCFDDAIFIESMEMCVTQEKVCPSSKCISQPDNKTFPASNTTAGYCRCLNNKATYHACAESGYVYNDTLGFCVNSNPDDCEEHTSTLAPKVCNGGYKEGDFIPKPGSCVFFYICYDGELLEVSCVTGYYYNEDMKACLPDTEGKCPECAYTQPLKRRNKRSVGTSTCAEGEEIPHPKDCDKYYKCCGGLQVLYSCGKDKLFNTTTLSCQEDVYRICWLDTCAGNQKRPQPTDCAKYIECCDGQQLIKECPKNEYFNGNTFKCEPDTKHICWKGTCTEGDKTPHPTDCNKYFECCSGTIFLKECKENFYFDKTTKACVADVDNICWNNKPCSCPGGYKEGEFSAHETDCDKFYICSNGKQVLQKCGEGSYFNNITLTCQPDVNHNCWPKVTCTCPGGYEEGEFSAHPTDCNKYYICHDGQQELRDCGVNNYFNKTKKTCEPDTYHVCWPNLCAGKPNGVLVANPQQCNAFYLCENEIAKAGSCLVGQLFDETLHVCKADLDAVCYNPCEEAGSIVLFAHPICNKYYFCDGKRTFVGTCISGSFNATTRVCDEMKSCYPNPCDDPKVSVFPDPYDSTVFYYCLKGEPTRAQCPPNREFDPNKEVCIKVSDADCPVCMADGAYPTLDNSINTEYCLCTNGLAVKIECPTDFVFNKDIGTCYSNAPCDPSVCPSAGEYAVFPNRNDTKSFCMCFGNNAVIIKCPNYGTFNPYTLECSNVEMSPECDQSKCLGSSDDTVYSPLNVQASNGICKCDKQIATFVPCPEGSTLNPALSICQLAEIHCNSKQCQGLANYTKIPAITTNRGYCECVAGKATYQNCPNYDEFDTKTKKCVPPICDPTACDDSTTFSYPAKNTTYGFCFCDKDGPVYKECPEKQIFSDVVKVCLRELDNCKDSMCFGRPDGINLPAWSTVTGFCTCIGGKAFYEDCPDKVYTFDETLGYCKPNTESLCSKGCVGSTYEEYVYAANGTVNGFCLCPDSTSEPVYMPCDAGHAFVPGKEVCLPTAKYLCDVSMCASATTDHPVTSPAKDSNVIFCYCTGPDDLMLLTCPKGKFYNHALKMCTSLLEEGCNCPDDLKVGEKVADKTSCNKYFQCENGIMQSKTCNVGYYFDVSCNECRLDTQGICTPTSSCTCLGAYHEGERLAHPVNPHMYYVCQNGSLHEHSCGIKHIFSDAMKQCIDIQRKYPRFRQQRSLDISNEPEFICNDNERRSVLSNCLQYEICINRTWHRKTCTNFHYYNPEKKKCLEPQDDFVCSLAKVTSLPTCNSNSEHRLHQGKSCQQYYHCHNGKWTLKSCDHREYFNHNLSTCMPWPPNTRFQCKTPGSKTTKETVSNMNTSSCLHLSQRQYEKNCAMFLICLDNDWWYQYCPRGMFFNRSLNYCVPDVQKSCRNSTPSKVIVDFEEFSKKSCPQDGLLRPSALACNRYFICLGGKWQIQHCPHKEYYNVANAKCLPDNEGVCEQLQVDCLPKEKRSVPRNCSLYEECSSDRKWLKLECPKGQIFDELLNRCISNQGICSIHGLKRACRPKEVMQVTENCSMFYYCSMDGWSLGKCLKGFMYSAERMMCVPHRPEKQCEPLILKESTATMLNSIHKTDLCIGKSDGTSVAHPSDCSRYFICLQGSTSHEMQCPKRSYFDNLSGYCRPNDNGCHNEEQHKLAPPNSSVCENKHGYLMPDPFNCNNFYVCIHHKLKHERCYSKHFFNATSAQCQQSPMAEKKTIENETPGHPNVNDTIKVSTKAQTFQCLDEPTSTTQLCLKLSIGTLLAESDDCRRYLTCQEQGKEPLSQRCRNGESFDSLLGFCRQNDGTCLLENGQRMGECSGKHGQLVRDPNSCRNYFLCINGQKIALSCKDDEYFSKSQNMCLKDTQQICIHLQLPSEQIEQSCVGLSENILYPYVHDSCHSYFQCIKGVAKIHKCADDLYFDPVAIKCVKNRTDCVMPTQTLPGLPASRQTFSKLCTHKNLEIPYANSDNDCRSFYVCHASGEISHELCPLGTIFSGEHNECRSENKTICT